jgi:hypothetical protein
MTALTRISGCVARATSGLSRRSALLIVGVLAGGLLWAISVAPAPVAFALTAGLAAAWCAWLERHPEAPVDAGESTDARALRRGRREDCR